MLFSPNIRLLQQPPRTIWSHTGTSLSVQNFTLLQIYFSSRWPGLPVTDWGFYKTGAELQSLPQPAPIPIRRIHRAAGAFLRLSAYRISSSRADSYSKMSCDSFSGQLQNAACPTLPAESYRISCRYESASWKYACPASPSSRSLPKKQRFESRYQHFVIQVVNGEVERALLKSGR